MNSKEVKYLTEAYSNLYSKPEFDQELYENLLSICLSEEIFDTVEECQYFAEQLILEDLSIEFLGDIAEVYDLDISEYLEETAGINIFERTRAIINALSRSGRAKAGLELGTALGRRSIEGVLNRVRGAAASTTIRSARRARPVVEPQGPGRYLDMLNTRRSQSGVRSPNSMTADAQRFQQLNRSASARSGKGAEDASAAAQAQQQARAFAPGIGDPIKNAFDFGKNSKEAQRLAVRAQRMAKNNYGKLLKTPLDSIGKYNTKDSDDTVRNRLKVGSKIVGTGSVAGDFDDAFKKARTSGAKEFNFKGEKYSTKTRSEEFDYFDIVMEHLISEGYADTNEAAIAIMGSMSEEWRVSIVEQSEPVKQNYRSYDRRDRGGSEEDHKKALELRDLIRSVQGNSVKKSV